MDSQHNSNRSATRAAWISAAGTCAAAVIACVSCVIAVFYAIPARRIAVAVATTQARQFLPNLELKVIVAESPTLDAPADRDFKVGTGLTFRLVPTPYQRLQATSPEPASPQGFLFFLITNRGPGLAYDVTVQKISWLPVPEQAPPDGLLENSTLGKLADHETFAILVDTAPGLTIDDLDKANAVEICVDFIYVDYLHQTHQYDGLTCLTDLVDLPPYMVP